MTNAWNWQDRPKLKSILLLYIGTYLFVCLLMIYVIILFLITIHVNLDWKPSIVLVLERKTLTPHNLYNRQSLVVAWAGPCPVNGVYSIALEISGTWHPGVGGYYLLYYNRDVPPLWVCFSHFLVLGWVVKSFFWYLYDLFYIVLVLIFITLMYYLLL